MGAIVLFDGVCNFCNSSVNYIIEHDKAGYFSFTPLQSEIGMRHLAEHKIDAAETDSVILIENGEAFTYSTAALKIARHLDGPARYLYVFIFLPKILRDPFYKLFAMMRYRLFGKKDACMMPTPEIRQRFLQ